MPANDLAYTPAWHLRELIASRKLSPVEVTGYLLIGREGDDATVLRASYAFEQIRPWQGRRPEVSA